MILVLQKNRSSAHFQFANHIPFFLTTCLLDLLEIWHTRAMVGNGFGNRLKAKLSASKRGFLSVCLPGEVFQ